MALKKVADLNGVPDGTGALNIRTPSSEMHAAVIEVITPALAEFPGVTDAAAAAAATAVADEVAGLAIVQTSGTGPGGLQERFPDATNAYGWKSDTPTVDGNLGTTLPGPPTIAALQKVGFPVASDAAEEEGVGFGIRAGDGRNTALETATTYDEVTGIVPRSLRAQIADGHVTAHHNIKGAALAALVPAGRYVLHEQSDGIHLILGERNA